MHIEPGASFIFLPILSEKRIPDADYLIACPAFSADFVNACGPAKGKKFYFVQGFEDWAMSKEEIIRTWKLPMKKITISRWLQALIQDAGETAAYIPNGLDLDTYRCIAPLENRPQKSILFVYQDFALRGMRYILEAIGVLKSRYPGLIVSAFGIDRPPKDFPVYIRYFRNPVQKQIVDLYNSSAIFISASLSEGWGLPPCEAMLCGCVVIASDTGGHREFLRDGDNGLMCTPASSESIVEKIEKVFSDPEAARRISLRAPASLQAFDWESRTDLFKNILTAP